MKQPAEIFPTATPTVKAISPPVAQQPVAPAAQTQLKLQQFQTQPFLANHQLQPHLQHQSPPQSQPQAHLLSSIQAQHQPQPQPPPQSQPQPQPQLQPAVTIPTKKLVVSFCLYFKVDHSIDHPQPSNHKRNIKLARLSFALLSKFKALRSKSATK